MRKKDLLKQNYTLFEQLQSANSQVLRLRFELEELKKKYDLLSQSLQEQPSDEVVEKEEEVLVSAEVEPSAEVLPQGNALFEEVSVSEEENLSQPEIVEAQIEDLQIGEAAELQNDIQIEEDFSQKESELLFESGFSVVIDDEKETEPTETVPEFYENEDLEEVAEQPQEAVQEVVEQNAPVEIPITQEQEYGAAVIGKIVLESARCCNQLTSSGDNRYKELVNLILGRAEVAKSEVLDIVSAKVDFSEKQKMMDACCVEALEYFANVMRQKED